MVKKLFTTSQIKKITGASRHESIHIPFYYAPPFIDRLREQLKSHLSSRGGRPTIEGAEIVRKVRFSQENWDELNLIATNYSQSGVSVSPAQVASLIVEEIISVSRLSKSRERVKGQDRRRSTDRKKGEEGMKVLVTT